MGGPGPLEGYPRVRTFQISDPQNPCSTIGCLFPFTLGQVPHCGRVNVRGQGKPAAGEMSSGAWQRCHSQRKARGQSKRIALTSQKCHWALPHLMHELSFNCHCKLNAVLVSMSMRRTCKLTNKVGTCGYQSYIQKQNPMKRTKIKGPDNPKSTSSNNELQRLWRGRGRKERQRMW